MKKILTIASLLFASVASATQPAQAPGGVQLAVDLCNEVTSSASVKGIGSAYSNVLSIGQASSMGSFNVLEGIKGATSVKLTGAVFQASTGAGQTLADIKGSGSAFSAAILTKTAFVPYVGSGSITTVGNAASTAKIGLHMENTNFDEVKFVDAGNVSTFEATPSIAITPIFKGYVPVGFKGELGVVDAKTSESWASSNLAQGAIASANGAAAVQTTGNLTIGKNAPMVNCTTCGGDHNPPSVDKEHKNNGWGNGDQDAPGKSGPHNNAENNHSGKNDPSHNKNGRNDD